MSTMLKLELDPRDAFDQLFVVGLAEILDAMTGTTSRISWRSSGEVILDSSGASSFAEAASAIHLHARQQADSPWLTTVAHLSVGDRSPLSPRIGKLSTKESFLEVEEARRALIDSVPPQDALTRRFIGSLGRPSDWALSRERAVLPDVGASAWEMKTRNRGEEFIQNRLSLLAKAVSDRTVIQIQDGLEGTSTFDEVGKNALNSRTPTGLRAPGPADNARAWCALWGLGALPVRPVSGGQGESTSVTTGAIRSRARVWFYLPVIEAPTTIAGFRAIVESEHLAHQAALAVQIRGASVSAKGVHWLEQHATRQFFIFHRHRSDNPNAPEHWAEPGVLHDLARRSHRPSAAPSHGRESAPNVI